MKKLKPVIKTSAAKQIADQIKECIIDGTFKGGDQLPTEHKMSEHFGVSRPTIREALKKLAAQNLITSRRGPAGGTFIRDYSVDDAADFLTSSTMLMLSFGSLSFSDVIYVRHFLQYECCLLVIKNWSDEKEVEIQKSLERLKSSELSDEEFCELDVQFHRSIIDATDNDMLKYMMYGVMEALIPVMNMIIVDVTDRNTMIEYYDQLIKTLSNQKPDKTLKILTQIKDHLSEKYSAAQRLRAEKHLQYSQFSK